MSMLQLLDLARENAELRREVERLRREIAALQHRLALIEGARTRDDDKPQLAAD